jgi:hypothetical protein
VATPVIENSEPNFRFAIRQKFREVQLKINCAVADSVRGGDVKARCSSLGFLEHFEGEFSDTAFGPIG